MTTKRRGTKATNAAATISCVHVAERFKLICDEIQILAQGARDSAAFHALESIESENQDWVAQRQQAIRMAGVAAGYKEALEVVRSHMVMA